MNRNFQGAAESRRKETIFHWYYLLGCAAGRKARMAVFVPPAHYVMSAQQVEIDFLASDKPLTYKASGSNPKATVPLNQKWYLARRVAPPETVTRQASCTRTTPMPPLSVPPFVLRADRPNTSRVSNGRPSCMQCAATTVAEEQHGSVCGGYQPEQHVGQIDPDRVFHSLDARISLSIFFDVHVAKEPEDPHPKDTGSTR